MSSHKGSKGLGVNIGKNDKPIIIKCGDEEVKISYSKRCSKNSIMINIEADKDKVHISTPHTIHKLYTVVDGLKERLRIAECLVERIYEQVSEPNIESPIYTVNPSFQQMKCLAGFIDEATNQELIDKMNLHGWYRPVKETEEDYVSRN